LSGSRACKRRAKTGKLWLIHGAPNRKRARMGGSVNLEKSVVKTVSVRALNENQPKWGNSQQTRGGA